MNFIKKVFGIGTTLTHYTIASKKIPQDFDGFKIVHLSDFHCCPKAGIISPIISEKPDIIVITGDMTDDDTPYDSFIALLRILTKLASVYTVSGNHDSQRYDFSEFLKKCRKLGALYLINESTLIKRGKAYITLHGLDDPAAKTSEIADKKIKDSLARLNRSENYEILLFHRANKLPLLADENFGLILSGHMHGGQIRLPYFGGAFAPKSCFASNDKLFFPDYSGGKYKLNATDVIVNRGMANTLPIPRLGNPTEIVGITLRALH